MPNRWDSRDVKVKPWLLPTQVESVILNSLWSASDGNEVVVIRVAIEKLFAADEDAGRRFEDHLNVLDDEVKRPSKLVRINPVTVRTRMSDKESPAHSDAFSPEFEGSIKNIGLLEC